MGFLLHKSQTNTKYMYCLSGNDSITSEPMQKQKAMKTVREINLIQN